MNDQPPTTEELRRTYESLGATDRARRLGPSRADHLVWCKERALEYVDAGDLQQAFASIASDLNKHPETADHPGVKLGMMLLMSGHLSTPDAMRDHIEGYN